MRNSPHALAAVMLASTAAATVVFDANTGPMIAVGDVYNVFFPSHHDHDDPRQQLQRQQQQRHPIIGSVIRQNADTTELFIRCDPAAALAAVGLSSSAHSHGSGEANDDGVEEQEHVQHHRRHAQAHAQNAHSAQHAQRSTLDDGRSEAQHQHQHRQQYQAGVISRCPIPGPGAYVTMRSPQRAWEYTIDDGAHYSRHEVCSTVSPSYSPTTAALSPQETSPAETAPQAAVVVECTWTEGGISATASSPTAGSYTTTLASSPPPPDVTGGGPPFYPFFFVPVTITAVPPGPEAMVELKLRQAATSSGANCPASTSSSARPSSTGTSTPSNGASGTGGSGGGSQPTSPSAAAPGVGGGAGALLAAVLFGVAAL